MSSANLPQDNIQDLPKNTSGPINLVVHIQAKSGKVEILRDYLKKVQAFAQSDKEPDTLTYNVTESANEGGEKTFVVYEIYKDAAAFKHHTDGADFKELFSRAEELVGLMHPRWYTPI